VAQTNNGDVSDDPLTTQLLDFFTKNIVPAVEEASKKQTATTAKAYLDDAEKARSELEQAYKKSLEAVDQQATKLVAAEKALNEAAENYRVRADGIATRVKQDSDAQVVAIRLEAQGRIDAIDKAATAALKSLTEQAEKLAKTRTAALPANFVADQVDRIVAEVLNRLATQNVLTAAPTPTPTPAPGPIQTVAPAAAAQSDAPNAVPVPDGPEYDDNGEPIKAPFDWKKWLPKKTHAMIGGGVVVFLVVLFYVGAILGPLFGFSFGTQANNTTLAIPQETEAETKAKREAIEREAALAAGMKRLNDANPTKLAFCDNKVCANVDELRKLPDNVRRQALVTTIQTALNVHLTGKACAEIEPKPTGIGTDGSWGGKTQAVLTLVCLPVSPVSLSGDVPSEADLSTYLQELLLALPNGQ